MSLVVSLLLYFASDITTESFFSVTGGKVLIVIGGDDSYKGENEEDTAFISRWAKRKISSQFSEELIDGRKSFIFSWNQEHRAIHEEALVHFLDERKRGEKFEYQPKGESSQVSETAMSPKANESTRGKDPLERKSTQGHNRRDPTRLDTFAFGDKPIGMNTYPGASHGRGMTENRTRHTGKDDSSREMGESYPQGGTEPLKSNSSRKASLRESTSLYTPKESSSRMDGSDPLQSDTPRPASSSSGNTTLHSGKEGSYRHMGDNDHSVGSDRLQSGACPTPSSGVYPSLYSYTRGGFQGYTSRKASFSSGCTSLHSGKEGSFPCLGESDHSVRSDPLQSGALGNSSSGGYPSPYSDKPGAFEVLTPAESKDTLQKGNT